MLDLHAASITGAATYTTVSTILAGNDGAPLAGVPVLDGANLVNWGGLTTIASPILAIKLTTQDQMDSVNAQEVVKTGGVEGIVNFWDNLPTKAQRFIAMKTAAVATMAYFTDNYAGGNVIRMPKYGKPGKNGLYSQVFGGALTAITWGTVAFAPASAMPVGKYAILGAYVSALTNYGLIRFQHANFGGLFPGFPVIDHTKASARAVVNPDDIFTNQGFQFSAMSDILGIPCCPVFNVTAQGTGLTIWAAAITADTPNVALNVVKLD